MALSVQEIEKEIHALSTEDKTALLRALIADLDDEVDENVEQLWLEEVQRRHRELQEGVVKAVPAEEVFTRARAKLKK